MVLSSELGLHSHLSSLVIAEHIILNRRDLCWLLAFVCVLCTTTSTIWADDLRPTLELRDGDRVVLLGGTFIEREGQFGYLETAMTTAWPRRKVTFRNLGWSGDTVWAESRGIFDPAQVGYQRMIDLVKELKPTLTILAYGQNESFAGKTGLAKLHRTIRKTVRRFETDGDETGVRHSAQVRTSPTATLPDASRAERHWWHPMYTTAVRELAQRRGASLVDLFELSLPSSNLSENGIHFGAQGYAALAAALTAQLHGSSLNPSDQKAEAIRQKIIEKNRLFFHRWRPQNITYLTGFRKHEQGNNAVEIAQFDPLVEKIESEIAELNRR